MDASLPNNAITGWNDPPNLPPTTVSASTTNRLKQMRTRPVHPSINTPTSQSAWQYTASAAQTNWIAQPNTAQQNYAYGQQANPYPGSYDGYGNAYHPPYG